MKSKSKLCSKRKTVNRVLALVLTFFFVFKSFDETVLAFEKANGQGEIKETETYYSGTCTHSGMVNGEFIRTNNVVTKEATSTEWGEVQKRCSFCGATVETVKVHPYDTYEVVLSNGTTKEVCGWFDSAYSREVYEQLNEYRAQNGLNKLVYNSSLEYASNIRALESYVHFSHTRPNGTKWNTLTSSWKNGGENIASGYRIPSQVMYAWKNSPGHNKNMLYGINKGETPYQGVSVGCIHVMTFYDNIPMETLVWSQNFTFYNEENENSNDIRFISQPYNIKSQKEPSTSAEKDSGKYMNNKWEVVSGKSYWYEGNVRQGTYDDPKGVIGDDTVRGREIYDPVSDGWYWLDSIYDGAKACGKEVWMPYIYQDENSWNDETMRNIAYESDEGMGECVLDAIKNKTGKWVRYDENGRMLKGWVKIEGTLASIYPEQAGNIYYYDNRTGLMAKGHVRIGGVEYYFDEVTGALR